MAGSHNGRVAAIVPLYNHARYIEAALASILAQGPLLREVIVIDDGSTDDSAAVMAALARREPCIRFLRQDNRGAHAALNAALALASAEFVAILNSDDAWTEDRLSVLVGGLDAHPRAALAASGIAFMDAAGRPVQNPWHTQALAEGSAAPALEIALINGNFLMTTSNYLFRRSIVADIGGFAALRYTHDLDFALRLLAAGGEILHLPAALLRYRLHGSNTISEDHRRVRAEWATAAAAWYGGLLERGDLRLAAALEDVLRRHELAKAVHLVAAWLRRSGGFALDRTPLLDDPAFLAQVTAWV